MSRALLVNSFQGVEPRSIATRALPPGSAPGPAAPGELFLGVEIDN